MFGFKSKFKVDNAWVIEAYHDVSLIGDHTFLSGLQEAFFLHQFQSIESSCGLEPCKKYSTKASSSNTLNNFKILELNIVMKLLFPDGLNLQELSFEDSDGLTSLEIVVLENITSCTSSPIANT